MPRSLLLQDEMAATTHQAMRHQDRDMQSRYWDQDTLGRRRGIQLLDALQGKSSTYDMRHAVVSSFRPRIDRSHT
jgi:hypothetical protein